MSVTVTINGVKLEAVLDAEDRREKRDFRETEISIMGQQVRAHISTHRTANQSGCRSGRGRIIYSRAASVGGAL